MTIQTQPTRDQRQPKPEAANDAPDITRMATEAARFFRHNRGLTLQESVRLTCHVPDLRERVAERVVEVLHHDHTQRAPLEELLQAARLARFDLAVQRDTASGRRETALSALLGRAPFTPGSPAVVVVPVPVLDSILAVLNQTITDAEASL